MKKMIPVIAIVASMVLWAAEQESAANQSASNELNTSTVETNSTNTSIPAMPIAAPAIQFEGC